MVESTLIGLDIYVSSTGAAMRVVGVAFNNMRERFELLCSDGFELWKIPAEDTQFAKPGQLVGPSRRAKRRKKK